jgi:hypothetical protein
MRESKEGGRSLVTSERGGEHRRGAAGFDFHGQVLERAREISADIRMNLLADNDPTAFTARQRVRTLVDRWLDANVKDEESVARYVAR